jgi:hypothetical protein
MHQNEKNYITTSSLCKRVFARHSRFRPYVYYYITIACISGNMWYGLGNSSWTVMIYADISVKQMDTIFCDMIKNIIVRFNAICYTYS